MRWWFASSRGAAGSVTVRIAPSSPVAVDHSSHADVVVPLRSQSSRVGARRHAASERSQTERRRSPTPRLAFDTHHHGPNNNAGNNAPTTEDVSGPLRPAVKRTSFRGQPIHFVFPAPHEAILPSSPGGSYSSNSGAAPKTGLVRAASLDPTLGIEYQQQLQALFAMCDGDDDGKLKTNEVRMLFELMGMSAERTLVVVKSNIDDTATNGWFLTTFSAFARTYRRQITDCAADHALPRNDFILRCKRLKHGLKKADGNGDAVMTREEFEIALQKLDITASDRELNAMFAILDRDDDGRVEWCDFVHAAWDDSLAPITETMRDTFSIDMFADLPSLFRPVSPPTLAAFAPSALRTAQSPMQNDVAMQGRRLSTSFAMRRASFAKSFNRSSFAQRRTASDSKSAIERIGVDYLTRISMERLAQTKNTIGRVHSVPRHHAPVHRRQTTRAGFSIPVRRQIRMIEATAIFVAALAGVVCGLLSTWFEVLIARRVDEESALSYVYMILVNIGVSILEVHGMYATAVVCAFRLTICTNLKLYPQDAEREFLTRSIARAALQVGLRKDKLFGIDPMKGSPRIVLFVTFLMYKSKRYVLKLLLKLLIKRVLWRAVAKTVLSLMVLPVNALMNAWTLYHVMLNCRVSIIGPPCVASLLEGFFLHDDELSPFQRVDCMRTIGCVLVTKRSIHPNVEIMIEHLRHRWLKPALWPIVDDCKCVESSHDACPCHVLDDMDLLLASITLYASQTGGPSGPSIRQHLRKMFFLLITTLIIDGGVDWVERRLFVRLCQAARMANTWKSVLQLKDDFVAGKGLHTNTVYAAVQELPRGTSGDDDQQQQSQRVPWRESIQYTASRISQYLAL